MKILLRNSFYTNEEKNIKTIKKKNNNITNTNLIFLMMSRMF